MDIKDTEVPGRITLSLNADNITDSKGRTATLDGKPIWSVQDEQGRVTLESQSDDGMSATFHITDDVGATQVQVNADGKQGPEVAQLTGTYVFNVTPGDAVALGDITASAITPD